MPPSLRQLPRSKGTASVDTMNPDAVTLSDAQLSAQATWALCLWGETQTTQPWGRSRSFYTYDIDSITQQASSLTIRLPGDQPGAAQHLLRQSPRAWTGIDGFIHQDWLSRTHTILTHVSGGRLEIEFTSSRSIAAQWDIRGFIARQPRPQVWREFSQGEALLLGELLPSLDNLRRASSHLETVRQTLFGMPFALTQVGPRAWSFKCQTLANGKCIPSEGLLLLQDVVVGSLLDHPDMTLEVSGSTATIQCLGSTLEFSDLSPL